MSAQTAVAEAAARKFDWRKWVPLLGGFGLPRASPHHEGEARERAGDEQERNAGEGREGEQQQAEINQRAHGEAIVPQPRPAIGAAASPGRRGVGSGFSHTL